MRNARSRLAALVALVTLVAIAPSPTSASAAGGIKLCIPTKANTSIKTPKATGAPCGTSFTLAELGAEGKQGPEGKEGLEGKQGPEGKNEFGAEEVALLKAVLPYLRFSASGIGGKPTIQFSGVNVQLIDGIGGTESENGTGNLVIGYDEGVTAAGQSGSHDLITGNRQVFTGYGDLMGGQVNKTEGNFGILFGADLKAGSGSSGAALVGGNANEVTAGTDGGTIIGGAVDKLSATESTIVGGHENDAAAAGVRGEDRFSVIVGGRLDVSQANLSAIVARNASSSSHRSSSSRPQSSCART
jgi:hypothetical protein